MSVNYRHGVPQIKAKPLRFFPCNKGIEYCYSLSKQGLSYVRWLNQSKPQEDICYLTMLGKVMQALPENLRYALGFSGLIRSSYRYHGPTRQLRLLDNTANPLIHVVVSHFDLQRENERLNFELFEAMFKEEVSEERRKRAEKSLVQYMVSSIFWVAQLGASIVTGRREKETLIDVISIAKLLMEQAAGTMTNSPPSLPVPRQSNESLPPEARNDPQRSP